MNENFHVYSVKGRSHTTVQHERTSYAHRKVGKSECVSYASLCVSHPESLRYMCVMCVTCTPMYGYVRWLLRTIQHKPKMCVRVYRTKCNNLYAPCTLHVRYAFVRRPFSALCIRWLSVGVRWAYVDDLREGSDFFQPTVHSKNASKGLW